MGLRSCYFKMNVILNYNHFETVYTMKITLMKFFTLWTLYHLTSMQQLTTLPSPTLHLAILQNIPYFVLDKCDDPTLKVCFKVLSQLTFSILKRTFSSLNNIHLIKKNMSFTQYSGSFQIVETWGICSYMWGTGTLANELWIHI